MEKDIENVEELEDVPDEHPDESELEQEEISEFMPPEVYWAEEIEYIEDPEIRNKEASKAHVIF